MNGKLQTIPLAELFGRPSENSRAMRWACVALSAFELTIIITLIWRVFW